MPEKFSASNAEKFINCHASANLDIAIPNWVPPEKDETADNAANRGTKMHNIFASVMALPLADQERMVAAIQYVGFYLNQRRWKKLIEVTEVADWLPSSPNTTADLVLYLNDELHIFDLKTGKILVDAINNVQMLHYAATYLKYAPNAKHVTMHIVQPWAEKSSAWRVDIADLFNWMLFAVEHDLQITAGDTTFMPGDHCQFCAANPRSRGAKGKPLCPAMMQLYYPEMPLNEAEILKEDDSE